MAWTLCLNTSTIKPQPLLDKIRLAGEAGFQAIELWVNDIYEHIGRGGEVRDVERALADQGLSVPCMIAARQWGEASQEEYPLMLDEVRRRLELAARFGSPWLVCSPPRAPCPLDQLARRYRDLLKLGRRAGALPTFEYISFCRSARRLSDAWRVLQLAGEPDGTLVLDAFHTWNGGESLEALRPVPAERISHYHIDDAAPDKPPGRQVDADRVLPGDGVIDLKAELRLLAEKGYRGAISLELFNPDLWARDPRDVLRVGIARLRQLTES